MAIVEMREYVFHPGGMQRYIELLKSAGIQVMRKYQPEPLAWYTTDVGDLNRMVHLWQYDSLEHRAQCRSARAQDPDWDHFRDQILPLIASQQSSIMQPVELPPADRPIA